MDSVQTVLTNSLLFGVVGGSFAGGIISLLLYVTAPAAVNVNLTVYDGAKVTTYFTLKCGFYASLFGLLMSSCDESLKRLNSN